MITSFGRKRWINLPVFGLLLFLCSSCAPRLSEGHDIGVNSVHTEHNFYTHADRIVGYAEVMNYTAMTVSVYADIGIYNSFSHDPSMNFLALRGISFTLKAYQDHNLRYEMRPVFDGFLESCYVKVHVALRNGLDRDVLNNVKEGNIFVVGPRTELVF